MRAGAIVPRGDIYQGNNKWTANWTATLTIEVFPSYNIPSSSFNYFNGNESIPIHMKSDSATKTVTVSYKGSLGIPGKVKVIFYGQSKNTTQGYTLSNSGMTIAQAKGFEDLFS